MRLLVIEDYPPMRTSLQRGLTDLGHRVDAVADGMDGLHHARSSQYDLVILDLMLPRLHGLELLRQLRDDDKTTPVLVLTARDALADRVAGLDCGADEYLVKPFAFDELAARVRALARRRSAHSVITVGDLEIDTVSRIARRGKPIALSAREYAVLECLAQRVGQVVSRSQLWHHVYDFASEPASNVVDVHINNLRRKIDDGHAHKLIHTQRGVGYVLAAD